MQLLQGNVCEAVYLEILFLKYGKNSVDILCDERLRLQNLNVGPTVIRVCPFKSK